MAAVTLVVPSGAPQPLKRALLGEHIPVSLWRLAVRIVLWARNRVVGDKKLAHLRRLKVANENLKARVHPNHAVKPEIACQAAEVERTLVLVVDEIVRGVQGMRAWRTAICESSGPAGVRDAVKDFSNSRVKGKERWLCWVVGSCTGMVQHRIGGDHAGYN